MNETEIYRDLHGLAEAGAERVSAWLRDAIAQHGDAALVLAGGSTPRRLHEVLSARAGHDGVAWDAVSIYFGDERAVAADHQDSNYAMAKASLLDRLPTPPRAVYRIEGERGSDMAARAYAALLPTRLDVVLLGMGEDGHTASLFPGRPEVDAPASERVVAAFGPKPPPERVSLSLGTLNSAHRVAFLVSGAGKAEALEAVLNERRQGAGTLPAARVQPATGELVFLVDTEAAARLGT